MHQDTLCGVQYTPTFFALCLVLTHHTRIQSVNHNRFTSLSDARHTNIMLWFKVSSLRPWHFQKRKPNLLHNIPPPGIGNDVPTYRIWWHKVLWSTKYEMHRFSHGIKSSSWPSPSNSNTDCSNVIMLSVEDSTQISCMTLWLMMLLHHHTQFWLQKVHQFRRYHPEDKNCDGQTDRHMNRVISNLSYPPLNFVLGVITWTHIFYGGQKQSRRANTTTITTARLMILLQVLRQLLP